MQPQFNLHDPPPRGKAYILLLQDPDDTQNAYGVWTTKAPVQYVHSKTYYALRDARRPLCAFLLGLKRAGKYPRIIVAGMVDKAAAPAALCAMKRNSRTRTDDAEHE